MIKTAIKQETTMGQVRRIKDELSNIYQNMTLEEMMEFHKKINENFDNLDRTLINQEKVNNQYQ